MSPSEIISIVLIAVAVGAWILIGLYVTIKDAIKTRDWRWLIFAVMIVSICIGLILIAMD